MRAYIVLLAISLPACTIQIVMPDSSAGDAGSVEQKSGTVSTTSASALTTDDGGAANDSGSTVQDDASAPDSGSADDGSPDAGAADNGEDSGMQSDSSTQQDSASQAVLDAALPDSISPDTGILQDSSIQQDSGTQQQSLQDSSIQQQTEDAGVQEDANITYIGPPVDDAGPTYANYCYEGPSEVCPGMILLACQDTVLEAFPAFNLAANCTFLGPDITILDWCCPNP